MSFKQALLSEEAGKRYFNSLGFHANSYVRHPVLPTHETIDMLKGLEGRLS